MLKWSVLSWMAVWANSVEIAFYCSLTATHVTHVQCVHFKNWLNFDNHHRTFFHCMRTCCTPTHTPAGAHLSAVHLFSSNRFLYLSVKSSAQSQRPRASVSKTCQLWGPICIHNFCQSSSDIRSVFPASVKSSHRFSNLNIISLTRSDNAASWPDTAVYHLSVTAWPKHCQATSGLESRYPLKL